METPEANSPEILRAEILAEARRECAAIIHQAENEAASLIATAKAETEKFREQSRASAQAEAARRRNMILATIPLEARRRRSERIEVILKKIYEAVRERLRTSDFNSIEMIASLAAEAVNQMPGTDFILEISPADSPAMADRLPAEISRRVRRSDLKLRLETNPTMTTGGVRVKDAEGLRIWDNQLLARLDRLWPELRRQIILQSSWAEVPDVYQRDS